MILFTAGRFRVCCSRSNTAGDRNKQSPTRKPPAKAGGYAQGCTASSVSQHCSSRLEQTKASAFRGLHGRTCFPGTGYNQSAAPSVRYGAAASGKLPSREREGVPGEACAPSTRVNAGLKAQSGVLPPPGGSGSAGGGQAAPGLRAAPPAAMPGGHAPRWPLP